MFDNFHEQIKYWQVPDDVALGYVPSNAWKAVALSSNGLDTWSLGLHGFNMTCVAHVTSLRFSRQYMVDCAEDWGLGAIQHMLSA